ncbi:MarR family transcriptional regulator [Catenovulum sp. 2E275]|uniref:MarR family winged helix-turn-helix transcriptional regulator n=1 Tax=Catenovulum sp. 2E275 TaxID=2980497 RepID=UPI0021D024F2|nr:MarR family transcriptional regulator [Catenovulum sp. 2E275]MCU4675939.1 MarR family transcriptional regulator [Catenovulum sp. 2E275]
MKNLKDNLGYLLTDTTRQLHRVAEKQFEQQGMTLAQARVLRYVSASQGIRQVELAQLLDIAPITLGRQIDALEQAGLIERRADSKDRRAYLIYLTDKASLNLQQIEQITQTIRSKALAGLSVEQTELLTMALQQMRVNLTKL